MPRALRSRKAQECASVLIATKLQFPCRTGLLPSLISLSTQVRPLKMMSDRACQLFVDVAVLPVVGEIYSHLADCGVYLEEPGSQTVSTLLSDGSQRRISRRDFDEAVKTVQSISFQMWRTPSEDVYCRFRNIESRLCIDFGMDGMSRQEAEEFATCLVSLSKRYATESRLHGLLVDMTGDCADGRWDDFFLHGGPLPSPLPSVIAVQLPDIRVESVRASAKYSEVANGVVFLRST